MKAASQNHLDTENGSADDKAVRRLGAGGRGGMTMTTQLQPVAHPPAVEPVTPCRAPEQIASLYGRGELDPCTITAAEERALTAWARGVEYRMQAKAKTIAATGSFKAHRRSISVQCEKFAARFMALWNSTPREYRPCPDLAPEALETRRMSRLVGIFGRIENVRRLSRPNVRLTARSKGSGQYRPIFRFGWTEQAHYRLLSAALEPFVGFHASQYQFRWDDGSRGSQVACKSLLDRLNSLSGNSTQSVSAEQAGMERVEDYVFLEFDVEGFFGSISEAWWDTKPLLERDLKRSLYTSYLKVMASERVRDRFTGAYDDLIRRGLPQGSALSALIAEWVMADVLNEVPVLPKGVFLFTFCDNIGVLAPRGQIGAVEELIRGAFRTSGAGPFNLRARSGRGAIPVTRPFRFLGMEFQTIEGRANIRPPSMTLDRATIAIRSDIMSAMCVGQLEQQRRKVLGKAAAWRLWPDAEAWRDEQLRMISVAMTVWGGSDPLAARASV